MKILNHVPRADEAELAVIGSLLTDPRRIDDVDLSPDDFFVDACQIVFELISDLHDGNRVIDVTLVVGSLRESGQLEKIGGAVAIKRMGDAATTSSNVIHYAAAVREASLRRQLMRAGESVIDAAYECDDATEAIERAERAVFGLAEHGINEDSVKDAKTAATAALDRIDARIRGDGAGLSTGIKTLDRKGGGLRPGEVTILAAPTSMGKTALAVNIAEHVALHLKQPVLYSSREMSEAEITERLFCSIAGVDSQRLQDCDIDEDERSRIADAAEVVSASPIWIDDASTRTVSALARIARRQKRQTGLALLIVDYLQLMSAELTREQRVNQVADMSRRLKALARELKVPVLCLAQLNRATEGNEGKRPRLSNLRESGSIEQDADAVWFVYRPSYYARSIGDHTEGDPTEIVIAKRRNGPLGCANVLWFGRTMQFRDQAPAGFDPGEASGVAFHDFSDVSF